MSFKRIVIFVRDLYYLNVPKVAGIHRELNKPGHRRQHDSNGQEASCLCDFLQLPWRRLATDSGSTVQVLRSCGIVRALVLLICTEVPAVRIFQLFQLGARSFRVARITYFQCIERLALLEVKRHKLVLRGE